MSDIVRKKRLSKPLRFIRLQLGMREGKGFQDIADECGCSYKTIERDFWEWNNNGGFEKWVTTEFMILHEAEINKEGKNDAYKVMADLKKRFLKERSEVEVKGQPKVVVEIIDNSKNPVSLTSAAT